MTNITKIYTPDLQVRHDISAVQELLDQRKVRVTERGNPRVAVVKLEEGKTYLMTPWVTKSGK